MKKIIALFLIVTLLMALALPAGAAAAEEEKADEGGISMETVDGDQVTKESVRGFATVFVFFNPTDNNSFLTLDDIQYSDWVSNSRVKVVAADVSGRTASQLEDYRKYYGFDDITFCYDKDGDGFSSAISEINSKIEGTEEKSPLIAITDQEGEVRHVFGGYQKPDYLKTFVEELSQHPDTPRNFKRNASGTLTWNSVAGASGYKVFRSEGGEYAEAASVTSCVWRDTDAEKGKTYFYKIKSVQEIEGIEVYSDYTKSMVNKKDEG